MPVIEFRFFGALNDFLPLHRRERWFEYAFTGPQSVKHLIEALHVPHPEVGGIRVNAQGVTFDYLPRHGDRIAVYPIGAVDGCPPLRPLLERPPRFLADNHLGRLTAYLRLLGFDTHYDPHLDDADLAAQAGAQQRVLLTRDRRLLFRSAVTYGYWVRAQHPEAQIREVVIRFNLKVLVRPFSRCLRCNGELHRVSKQAVLDRLEPKTRRYFNEFSQCDRCGQVYWAGSHFARLEHIIARAMEA